MATTGDGQYIPSDLEQWASNHETSHEIALAIDTMCKTDAKRERLWQDPTEAEMRKILRLAWKLAGDKTTLYWGENTIRQRGGEPCA